MALATVADGPQLHPIYGRTDIPEYLFTSFDQEKSEHEREKSTAIPRESGKVGATTTDCPVVAATTINLKNNCLRMCH